MSKILAVSASLRNARWGRGIINLLAKIRSIPDETQLIKFLDSEAYIHYQQFLDAGRKNGVSFDTLYKNLRRLGGEKGLCNSEVGMVAALWSAYNLGCEIEYLPLSTFFTPVGKVKALAGLKKKIKDADGLLMCTPVYFGDRSSLASNFMGLIQRDDELIKSLYGKPMVGVSVGAKRNGGQETTLIYQLYDMLDIGMLGLGNDSETTAQYGGTIVAGDVGTAAKDEYGLKTAMGAGRRLARTVLRQELNREFELKGKLRVMFWVLQDANEYAADLVDELIQKCGESLDATVFSLTDTDVARCMACDICPPRVGSDREYRCILKNKSDTFARLHSRMVDQDLIVPVVLSLKDKKNIHTVYQSFLERTRYLRRGDYFFSEVAILPMVIEEIGATENMHLRMLTSLIRHHTVMLKPIVGYLYEQKMINKEKLVDQWLKSIELAKKVTVGKLASITSLPERISYKPVGYVLSASKKTELSVEKRARVTLKEREKRMKDDASVRLGKKPGGR